MKDRVLKIISEQFGKDISELKEDMSFSEDLNADSIELVEMVMNIEDELGIELDDDKISDLKTIGDVLEYIEKYDE